MAKPASFQCFFFLISASLKHRDVLGWCFFPDTTILKSILLIGCLSCLNQSYSQTIIKGKILDADSGQPIPYAQAGIRQTPVFTTADQAGNFSLHLPERYDSITFYSFGYREQTLALNDSLHEFIVLLESDVIRADAVVIYQDEPEVRLVKRVLKKKPIYRPEQLAAFEYEQYEKIKIGDKDYEKIVEQWYIPKAFDFFFKNSDTLEGTTYLPLFIIENVKKYWYLKKPRREKEETVAARVSGIENPSLTRIFSDRTLSVDIYDNYLNIFNKNFISPLSDNCLSYYHYQIDDTTYSGEKRLIHLSFRPRHKQEMTVTGSMIIIDSLYVVDNICGKISDNVNINFIRGLSFTQQYQLISETALMKTDERFAIHGTITIPLLGQRNFFGTKEVTYRNIICNARQSTEFYSHPDTYDFSRKSDNIDTSYWQQIRHFPLRNNDRNLYHNTDSVKQHPLFKNMLILFTGYKRIRNWQVGPYFNLYAYNPVERHRFRLGLRSTPAWNSSLLITSYMAYGTGDQKFKYQAGAQYFFSKMPRHLVSLLIRYDLQQLTWSQNFYRTQETILSTLFKISASNKLIMNHEVRLQYGKEWKEGLMQTIQFRRNEMQPLRDLRFEKLTDDHIATVPSVISSELALITHWGIGEKYLAGDYKRLSLGSPLPIFDLILCKGFSGFLGGDYDYYKGLFSIRQRLKTGYLGYTRYRLETGKLWGNVPYPLLELHNGNQTIFYDDLSYNTMNFLEFASDQYASLFVTHFFDGYFFNKIPILRALKWREVVSGRVLAGSLKSSHQDVLLFPENLYRLNNKPYAEAGFGIDNIFKVIRVDFLWRLSYLDHTAIDRFRIMGSLHINF